MAADPKSRCPCGSGRTSKRCCGRAAAMATEAAVAHLAGLVVPSICMVVSCTPAELAALYDEALELPALHPSLRLPLPLEAPAVAGLVRAAAAGDAGGVDAALPGAVSHLDTPAARADLARAATALRDAGRVAPRVAAVALLELSTPKLKRLLTASVRQAAAAAGSDRLRAAG
ncbi:MAG: SEC-C domain-containing protein [Actinomycetota bacterium]